MLIPIYINLNNIELISSTGSISIQADENSIINSNLDLRTNTGSIALFAKKANFTQGLLTSI
ncbi:MAG: hypothetical protein ACFFG0_39140 [Candidatus Thorarchaeota archaeon]